MNERSTITATRLQLVENAIRLQQIEHELKRLREQADALRRAFHDAH